MKLKHRNYFHLFLLFLLMSVAPIVGADPFSDGETSIVLPQEVQTDVELTPPPPLPEEISETDSTSPDVGDLELRSTDTDEPSPTPPGVLGSLDYYRWRYNDFMKRHPNLKEPDPEHIPDYYLGYGEKYVLRFSNELRPKLSDKGKLWLDRTRMNLQLTIENLCKNDPEGFRRLEEDPKAFRKFAFDAHPDAYWKAGLYDLPIADLIQIGATPDFADSLGKEGRAQIMDIMGRMAGETWNRAKKGVGNLVTNPVGAVSNAIDSVGQSLKNNWQSLTRGSRALLDKLTPSTPVTSPAH